MLKHFVFFFCVSGICIYSQPKDSKTLYKTTADIESIQDKQLQAFFYNTIGEDQKSLLTWEEAGQKSLYEINSIPRAIKTIVAIPYILTKAKAAEYVILNEAHHRPEHRIFARQLLEGLWKQGYRNLSVETLSTDSTYYDKELNTRKYPLVNSGSYSREPQFGNFIREALNIGFFVFPYDRGFNLPGKQREEQAAAAILETKQDGKTLVYCGFDHAAEGPSQFWGKALAEQLKQETGKDPLSIDQTVFNASHTPSYEHPWYVALASDQPMVIMEIDKPYVANNTAGGYYDLTVVHPRSTQIKNRPSWLFTDDRQAVAIGLDTIRLQKPYLLMAFVQEENPEKAVPVDIVQIDDTSAKEVYLVVPKNKKHIIIAVAKEGQQTIR